MEAGTVAPAAASTGSKTIADLMALATERHGAREAQRYKREGEWHTVSYEELGRAVSEIARGLIDLGIEPGERVSLLCSDAARVDLVGLRHLERRRGRRADLPDQRAERVRVGRGQLGVGGGHLRGRHPAGQDRRGPREPPRPAPHRRHRADRRRGRRDLARRPARARPRPRRGGAARAPRGGHARRPLHDHLHLGHHRAAEGLRALAPQLPPGGQHVRGDRGARGGRPRLPLPAARARLRAADPAARDRPRRPDRLLRRGPEADRARADGGPPGLPPVGAADLREDLHARHLQRRPRADPRCRAGRPQGARARRRPARRSRPSCRRTTTRPTRRCSRTSAAPSAASSSRPTRARRRSPRRSSSSSTPAACRSWRATG